METKFFPALDLRDIPQNEVKKVTLTYKTNGSEEETEVFLAALPDGLTAFSASCSHLGCSVDWNSAQGQFLCPCHGSKYDINGNVLGGPAPEPLTRLPVETREEKVFVGIEV
jgi:Rieske Fe-S protein